MKIIKWVGVVIAAAVVFFIGCVCGRAIRIGL